MKYNNEALKDVYSEDAICFFWGHQPAKDGIISESCLSQWWNCTFMENQILFCCAEQYMMYRKAMLFKDFEYAQKILFSKDSKKKKRTVGW